MLRAALLIALAGPVAAEQITYAWTPSNDREARALSTGLALHSLRGHLREGGEARDWARAQVPGASRAVVSQRGRDHVAQVRQGGGGNALALIQRGRGAAASVAQDGGDGAVILQYGWD